jgi:hypothetical protein
MLIGTELFNPSDVSMGVGQIKFLQTYKGYVMGILSSPPGITMRPGTNKIQFELFFSPRGQAAILAGQEMMSRYISRQDQQVSVTGFDGSTNIESLKAALSAVKLTQVLPGLKSRVIQSIFFSINILTALSTSKGTGGVVLINPFDESVIIFIFMSCKSSISYRTLYST